jgi:glycosyltransferase involved in cell wall biosynthesis
VRLVHFLHGRANPNGTNGGDRVIYNLAKRTAELGAQVFVFGLSEKDPFPVGRALVQSFTSPRDPFSIPSVLKKTLREVDPDVVHFHGVYTLRNARLAGWLRRHGIPYVVSPHGGLMKEVLSRGRARKIAFLALFGKSFCRGASYVHCVSEAEAEAVRSLCGDVCTVIGPHGLEGTSLSSLDSQTLHRQFPMLKDKRVFGFLGRLDPAHKGLDLVVEACALVRQSLSGVAVVLAGPDWKDRTLALHRKVAELRLQDTVIFVGPKMGHAKFNFLASCDVFVHPSRWEAGLPFSVLDALELGKPCLVSKGEFFGDFFQQHSAGIQVPLTTEGVAQGLRWMAEARSDQLQAMGAEGREAVLREFSWERTAQTLLEAYAPKPRSTPAMV